MNFKCKISISNKIVQLTLTIYDDHMINDWKKESVVFGKCLQEWIINARDFPYDFTTEPSILVATRRILKGKKTLFTTIEASNDFICGKIKRKFNVSCWFELYQFESF